FSSMQERNCTTSYNQTTDSSTYAVPTVFTPAASHPAVENDFTQAAANSVNAVVSIKSTTLQQQSQWGNSMEEEFFKYFFGQGRRDYTPQPRIGMGSGVIISEDGYIVTNNHVIENADKIEVTLNDSRLFEATLVGNDPLTDIALLKIDADNLPILRFGDSDKLQVGEWVLAVGNPFQLNSTVTAGIVSAKSRNLGMISQNNRLGIESFIQTDAAVNPGNSGGALVNTNGELVGINTAIYSETGNFTGYSFAIPTSIVSKVITDLKQYGTVQRAMLGVTIMEMSDQLAKEKKIELRKGVYVSEVSDRSAALEAGLQEGDVITAINGVATPTVAILQEQITRYRPGDKVKVEFFRGKEKKTVDATLKNSDGNTDVTKATNIDMLGATLKEADDATKAKLHIRGGVEVTKVKEGQFKKAGIRNGFIIVDINGNRITYVKEVESLFQSLMRGETQDKVMFIKGIYPDGRVGYYAVPLAE
ncbi:MAG: Do family serine endopeptidase, partial [Porphyromonadaceae bacterium]|nr:Do family serine endopeptidase [Porphyromonadaceae bacterium]